MRISDWSSDVCSADLGQAAAPRLVPWRPHGAARPPHHDRCDRAGEFCPGARIAPCRQTGAGAERAAERHAGHAAYPPPRLDRKSVVEETGVSVSVHIGGRRNIKKKKPQNTTSP